MTWPNLGESLRPMAMGRRGAVSSAHPLASGAGMRVLQAGGNAVDAAVATAAALNVAEPYMSGIGGTGYMLIYTANDRRLRVLDYVGPTPRGATFDAFGSESEKNYGPKAPLVPSACAGWLNAHEAFGSLPIADVFGPAIEYADNGVPLTVKNARYYGAAYDAGNLSELAKTVFMPTGSAPGSGQIIAQSMLAETFREVCAGGIESFYRGTLAKRIAKSVQNAGGLLTEQDLEEYAPVWKEPLSVSYRGYTVACPPPRCSGWQYLQSLKMLEAADIAASGHNTAETLHLLGETFKLSVADRIAYTTSDCINTEGMLSQEYVLARNALVDRDRAQRSEGDRYGGPRPDDSVQPGDPAFALKECTTHFDVVDAEGNAVAVTQSLGDGFGSGFMAGDTGIMLNNFGYWFDFDQTSPNAIGPGKQIEMCVAPAAVLQDDQLFMVIGTPGSFGILQTTPQMISNVIDHQMSVQAAIEAPRIKAVVGTDLQIESRIGVDVRSALEAKGHTLVDVGEWSHLMGGGQGIMIDPESGAYAAGADPRRDGYALAW